MMNDDKIDYYKVAVEVKNHCFIDNDSITIHYTHTSEFNKLFNRLFAEIEAVIKDEVVIEDRRWK